MPNTQEAMGFPSIPGAPSPTGMAVGLIDYDFGPELRANDFSGVITRQPPGIKQIIGPLMPKVGADGNETAGVPSVLHQAPLGTYTGWNVVGAGFFKGQPCGGGLVGGYIPFARTQAERAASGDSATVAGRTLRHPGGLYVQYPGGRGAKRESPLPPARGWAEADLGSREDRRVRRDGTVRGRS